jgi:hypothetical protein
VHEGREISEGRDKLITDIIDADGTVEVEEDVDPHIKGYL